MHMEFMDSGLETQRLDHFLSFGKPVVAHEAYDKELMSEYSRDAGVIFTSAEMMPTVLATLLQNDTLQEELREKGRTYIENNARDDKFVCEASSTPQLLGF